MKPPVTQSNGEVPAGGQGSIGLLALTKTQMAAALQVSVAFLNGMMKRGEISYWKMGRKLVRFRTEEALRRIEQTCSRGTQGTERQRTGVLNKELTKVEENGGRKAQSLEPRA